MKRMGKLAALAAAFLMAFSVSACGVAQLRSAFTDPEGEEKYRDLEPLTLVYADGAAAGAVGNLWAKAFISNIEEITGGKITVDYYGNSQMGDDSEIAALVQKGTVDLCNMQPGNLSSTVPELYVFDMPMVFAGYDADTIDQVLKPGSEFFGMLNAGFEDAGLELVDTLQAATFREMSTNKPVRTIDDFSGIRIRTMASTYSGAFWESLGCSTETIAFTDLYDALSEGTVEAEENALDTQVNAKLYEVQDHVILTHHTLYLNLCIMNRDRWESLDPLCREAIAEANRMADEELSDKIRDINDQSRKKMEEHGVTVMELDEETRKTVTEKAQPVCDLIRQEIGDEICDSLLNGLADAK